ncbi:hypothetical protein [Actinoplanes sp. URMC 104]|uniref:hypothetical protein n=1 Tax=Actinoplanes sp. URMC 104 TaxID=3423409 RepID=UPI003F1E3300
MSPAAHVFRIDGVDATPFQRSAMAEQGLLEVEHLERWVVDHPEILGGSVRIVTKQFDRWATSGGQVAAERLDILGLDSTGQLVVVELKRDGDKRVHLQALTYAALVAGFTKESLGSVHADYLNKSPQESPVTPEAGLAALADHVEGDWGEELLTRPRIVLIAERFPSQVMTTVNWLTELSPRDLVIQCIELSLFRETDESRKLCATFQQIFPIDDIADRILGPTVQHGTSGVSAELAARSRRQRSVAVIVDNGLIPKGATLALSVETLVRPQSVAAVRAWMEADPNRSTITWTGDRAKPLKWAGAPDVDCWSASKLAQNIVEMATGESRVLSGPDAWTYEGKSLYWIANEFLAGADAETT